MKTNLFSQQKEIQRQHKIIEDLEDIVTKTRRVGTVITYSISLFYSMLHSYIICWKWLNLGAV